MNKSTISIFFSVMFLALTLAPNVLAIIDDNYEIMVFVDSNEKEEKNGEEKVKDIEVEVPLNEFIDISNHYTSLLKQLSYRPDNYNSLVKELVSPPPELNI